MEKINSNEVKEKNNGKNNLKKIGFNVKSIFVVLGIWLLQQLIYELVSLPFLIGLNKNISTIISSLILVLGIFLSYKIAEHYKLVNLKNIFSRKNIKTILIGYIIVVLTGYLGIILQTGSFLSNRNELYSNMFENSSPSVAIIQVTLFAPIIEEVLFRGFIIGVWFKKMPKIGIVVNGLLFSLVHFPNNIMIFLVLFTSGIVFGLIYYKCKRLEFTASIHILNNLPGGIEMFLSLL